MLEEKKFAVGDRVYDTTEPGIKGIVKCLHKDRFCLCRDDGQGGCGCAYTWCSNYEDFEKEKIVSKYEELKSRIEALNNGWTKEADDILQEIPGIDHYFICIRVASMIYDTVVEIQNSSRGSIQKFKSSSQCQKHRAFKNALLWLLDHSDIKKDLVGQEVVAAIEGKVYKVKVLETV